MLVNDDDNNEMKWVSILIAQMIYVSNRYDNVDDSGAAQLRVVAMRPLRLLGCALHDGWQAVSFVIVASVDDYLARDDLAVAIRRKKIDVALRSRPFSHSQRKLRLA